MVFSATRRPLASAVSTATYAFLTRPQPILTMLRKASAAAQAPEAH